MHRRHERAAQEPPPDADEPPPGSAATSEEAWVLHFAGRPVALFFEDELGATRLVYLTTDHLGAPMLATDAGGAAVWQGGIAPFGEPYTLLADTGAPGDGDGDGGSDADDPDEPPLPPPPPPPDDPVDDGRDGSSPPPPGGDGCTTDCDDGRSTAPLTSVVAASLATPAAQPEGIFLRYPGQWSDPVFEGTGLPTGMSYNVNRWYEPKVGRYTRPDPLGRSGDPHPYLYAGGNPLLLVDPLGLVSWSCKVFEVSGGHHFGAAGFFVECDTGCVDGYRVLGHYLIGGVGLAEGVTLPVEVGYWQLEDHTSTADTKNLEGPFGLGSCSITIGAGFSVAQVFQGKGHGSWSAEPSFGLGAGCLALGGYSKLVNTRDGCCVSGPNPVITAQ
jgi:RHS repeat-associated protein